MLVTSSTTPTLILQETFSWDWGKTTREKKNLGEFAACCCAASNSSRPTLTSGMFVDVHFRTAGRRTAPAVAKIKRWRSRRDVQSGAQVPKQTTMNHLLWPLTHTEPCEKQECWIWKWMFTALFRLFKSSALPSVAKSKSMWFLCHSWLPWWCCSVNPPTRATLSRPLPVCSFTVHLTAAGEDGGGGGDDDGGSGEDGSSIE